MGNSASIKPLVLFHAACSDGFGAAFAAWLKLGDEAEYLPIQYGDINTHLEYTGRDLYVLDFSFPREVMGHMFSNARRVVWLDHHKTAFEMWCGEIPEEGSWCEDTNFMQGQHMITLDNSKSGAMLAWEYFHPDTEIPMIIKHIDDYDRWVFALKGTKAINKAIWSYAPWSFKQWKHWLGNNPRHHLSMVFAMREEGKAILRAHNQNVHSVVKGAARKCSISKDGPLDDGDIYTFWQKDGLAANCPPHLQSDVGHELANQSGTYGLLWHINKDGKCLCSLRSNGDYDVSAIAKAFGGGGHKNAAGFETDIATLLSWFI